MEGKTINMELLKRTLDFLDEKIFIIDNDYNLVYKNWNPTENFQNIKCWEILHKGDKICSNCNVEKVLKTGLKDSQLYLSDKGEYFKMESFPIYFDDNIKYIAVHLKKTDKELKKKLLQNDSIEFERLINKVYNSFVDLSENPFKSSVKIIGEKLGITAIAVHRINRYTGEINNIAKWRSNGIYHPVEKQINFNSLHWLNSVMHNSELLAINDLSDLPVIASTEREILQKLKYNAAILYPIKIDNKLDGILFIGSEPTREWTHFEISFIKQYGRILKTAFIQKDKQFKSESSRKRLEIAQAVSNSGSFQWYFDNQKLHISKNLKSIWGFNPLKKDYTLKDFARRIHKEDISFVKKEFKKSLKHRFPLNLNFRIIVNGKVKYISLIVKYIFDYLKVESLIGVIKDNSNEQSNNNRVNNLLENSFYPNFTINSEFEIVSVNKGFEQLLGLKLNDIKGKSLFELTDKTSGLKLKTADLFGSKKNQVKNLEINFISKNNSIINTQLNGLLIKNDNISNELINFTVHDITSIIRALETLQASERRFKSTLESMHLFAVLLNQKGEIIFCNKFLLEKTGYSFSELLNQNWFDLIVSDEDKRKVKTIFELAITDESVINNLTYKLKTKNGTTLIVEWSNSVSKSRELTVFSSIGKDVTEFLKQQKEIKKLSESVEQSPDSVIIINNSCYVEYVNNTFTKITGYDKKEAKGKRIEELGIWENFEKIYADICKTVHKKEVWKRELLGIKKDNTKFWMNVSVSPILNEAGKVTNFVCIFKDITEDKKLREELKLAKEKAELANKLKTEFLAQMSHEIRTPIHSILCLNGIIEGEYYDNAIGEVKEAFYLIKEAGNRIIRTIDLILNLSDLQAGTYNYMPSKTDIVNQIIHPIVKQYRYVFENKNIKFKLQNSSSNPVLFIDQYSVSQIFDNLINNASKYTKKGEVSIIIEENQDLIVKVKDTGIGISEDYLPNIFNLFSQENHGYKRIYEGNGIGLALVRKYADINNIKIDVISEKGKGTEFILTFKK